MILATTIAFSLGGLIVGIIVAAIVYFLLAWLLSLGPPQLAARAQTIALIVAVLIVLAFTFDVSGSSSVST